MPNKAFLFISVEYMYVHSLHTIRAEINRQNSIHIHVRFMDTYKARVGFRLLIEFDQILAKVDRI